MRIVFLVGLFVALIMEPAVSAANSPVCRPENVKPSAIAFLKKRLVVDKTFPLGPIKLSVARVATKAAPGFQYLALVDGGGWTGEDGGSRLIALRPHGQSYDVIGETPNTWRPIRVLRESSLGRPKIGVEVPSSSEGGAYEAVMVFDGKTYPDALYDGSVQVQKVEGHRIGVPVITNKSCQVIFGK